MAIGPDSVSPISGTRLIVTGQIGCGKTTLAAAIAEQLELVHVRLDEFNGRPDAKDAASTAVAGVSGGWVVDGCVWQVPDLAWSQAGAAIHLDYANRVHHRRIVRRAIRRSIAGRSIRGAREVIAEERGHLEIMRRYADANRREWVDSGGITSFPIPVIRLGHPREARGMLTEGRRGGRIPTGSAATSERP